VRRARDDEGTILVLTLGLVGLLLVVVAVVVDVSAVILAKRGVASAADGAAISAAQALDEQALYDEGLGARIPLSGQQAAARVAAYQADAAVGQPGLRLAVRIESGTTAVVTGTRRVRPPFAVFGEREVVVTAVARARAPVVQP
jgi:Flp pilus assembly protein TadG